MSFADLDSISFHTQQTRFHCADTLLGYRGCSVQLKNSPGRMDALIDGDDRVVELKLWTGLEQIESGLATNPASYDMLMGLANQSTGLAEQWSRVATSDTAFLEDLSWTETWTALDGRWLAQIVWQGTGKPSMITTVDAPSVDAFKVAQDTAEGGSRP